MLDLRASLLLLTCVAGSCRAQQATQAGAAIAPFAPAQVRLLRSFGAVGDGRSDDTAAMLRALQRSDVYCLDGERRAYRVTGTLRVSRSICLRNATLVQSAVPVITSPYITHGCAPVQSPSAVSNCGDPAIPADLFPAVWRSLSIRTLLIRPGGNDPLRVNLEGVKVDRGRYAEGGSRSDSAGIWLDGADGVRLRNVEITGDGKGYGLLVTNARNVRIDNLWVHDLVWAPYRGERALTEPGAASTGWNAVPIHELREPGRDGVRAGKFYGVRIQEQLTCVFLANVAHVVINNARIERCLARFPTGDLPWQTDGLDIGRSSSDIRVNNSRVSATWEGMEVAGGGDGIEGLVISGLSISNSFSFGLKMGYDLRNATVRRLAIDHAGLSGIVLYGPVRNVRISSALIRDVGAVRRNGGSYSPWPAGNRSGIRLDEGSGTGSTGVRVPDNVIVEDIAVVGQPNQYEYGILNTGGKHIDLMHFNAQGFGIACARGIADLR